MTDTLERSRPTSSSSAASSWMPPTAARPRSSTRPTTRSSPTSRPAPARTSTAPSTPRRRPSRPGRRRRRRIARCSCSRSPTRSRPTPTSSAGSRAPTPASRSAPRSTRWRLRRPVPLLRRRGAGHGRPGRQRVRRRPHLDHPARPDRRRRLDRAVELPAVHGLAGSSDPALATGNTVVLKPSARTPLTALAFAEILAEIFPAGVVNVLSGSGADIGDALVAHPTVRMVSITGDTVTGKRIAQDRVRHRQAAPPGARWQGAGHRLRRRRRGPRRRDAPVRRLLELRPGLHGGDAGHRRPEGLRQLRVRAGRPGPHHQVGRPGRGRRHRDGLADRRRPRPTRSRAWSTAPARAPRSWSVASGRIGPARTTRPTVIAGPDQKSEIIQDEIFGPVVTVQRFSDEDQAVAWANDTPVRPRVIDLHDRHRQGDAGRQGARVRPRLDQRALHPGVRDARTAASSSPAGARTARSTRSRTTRSSST